MDGSPYHPPRLELSTFYSVAVSKSGQVMKVDTADMSVLDDDALIEIATEIIDSGKSSGVTRNLIYLVEDKGVYNLVAFLDNTVMLENAGTLLNYTLIFGGVALVALFLLAMFLANWIVTPLEESYKRQKQFVADAGHELKTPVAVINANLELLAGETGENQWLSNIRYENERMSALISQLLDLARAENAKPPMGVVDFSRLVYGEALPFETYAYESGLKLEYDVSDDILVYGNSVQLRQLVCALIDNAICHSSNGNEIFISLKKEKKHVRLCVVNSGEEIPAEQRKYLFERFYRLDAARPDDKNNYGLGLAIAKAIVTVHKGTIQLRCESGKVELIVKLPVAKQKHKN
ncbi:MAG TPA: HAMP domain-containing histidine kinase [Candidatus Faeciplasma gallinarum]|uniref:histidine kinase n=1 Tax=Candidatus Faeciplasma gallinarum TaxID=2840799 RepID=A0A9D1JII0_9FIRM|nr:HAMP domain-containing histidine kinase [Candidatus Faeciplasma gallinarum]